MPPPPPPPPARTHDRTCTPREAGAIDALTGTSALAGQAVEVAPV